MSKTEINNTMLELKTKGNENQQKDKKDSMSLVIRKLCANARAAYYNLKQKTHISLNLEVNSGSRISK